MKFFIFFFLVLSLYDDSYAINNLKTLFEGRFYKDYVARKCGPNIVAFLDAARGLEIDIANARIIEISNSGFSTFGMINVEYARESGKLNPDYPARGFRNLPGNKNWHHHVIMEMDGMIYDFDFGNTPEVVSVAEYFEKMFLDEDVDTATNFNYAGREEKLKKYQLVVRSALELLSARDKNIPDPQGIEFFLDQYLTSVE